MFLSHSLLFTRSLAKPFTVHLSKKNKHSGEKKTSEGQEIAATAEKMDNAADKESGTRTSDSTSAQDSENQNPSISTNTSVAPQVPVAQPVPVPQQVPVQDDKITPVESTPARTSEPRINTFPIVIDDGIHDFDFSQRKKGSQRTRGFKNPVKLSRRLCRKSSSEPNTAVEAATPTNTKSTSSIRLRLRHCFKSTLRPFRGIKAKIEKQNNVATKNQSPIILLDPLPQTREGLETRMNYHIAELKRLQKQIRTLNEHIRENSARAFYVNQRASDHMPISGQHLRTLVDHSREIRNSYGEWVGYHRRELERIMKKREAIDRASDIEPVIPEILRNLENGFEWRSLFTV